MAEYEHVKHGFDPVYNENARILILGSLPSVKSREEGFYYGHPRNRFWQVLARLLDWQLPQTIEEKKNMLLENGIAIWDVIQECDIIGSSDSSIKNVKPTQLGRILHAADIIAVYGNGKTASKLYRKYQQQETGTKIRELPSTSPANAAFSLERLVEVWGTELTLPMERIQKKPSL